MIAFAAPWALLLLLPWLAAALWLLLATREPAYVPFVRLWPANRPQASARRARRRPPWWLIGMLAALLAAILAAAGPGLRGAGRQITLVVDCGLALSPAGRVQSALDGLHLSAADRLHVVPVPGEAFDSAGPLDVRRLRFSAIDTAAPFDRALRAALAVDAGHVVAVTDAPPPPAIALSISDSRLTWAAPTRPLVDAGIERFVVKDVADHRLQAMVRVFNGTPLKQARLTVGDTVQTIDLPPAGQSRDYFADLTDILVQATASLDVQDDIKADNFAFVARQDGPRRIAVPNDASAALRRMIAAYAPHNDNARAETQADPVRIQTTQPPTDQPAVWLAGRTGNEPMDGGRLNIVPDSIDRDVDWRGIAADTLGQPAPPGWTVLVGDGRVALLAIRGTSPRQVWVGFDLDAFSRWADYVILWKNILDGIHIGPGPFLNQTAGQRLPATVINQADPSIDASPGFYSDNGFHFAIDCEVPRGAVPWPLPTLAMNTLHPAIRPVGKYLGFAALLLLAVSLEARRRAGGRLT